LVFMEKYKLKLLVDFRKEFPPLEELATNLSFDQIMREPPAARYRLMELMRVSKKECEVKILINALSRVRSKQIEVALPGDLLDEKGGNQ